MIYVVLCCFKIEISYINKFKAVHFLFILLVKKYSISLGIKTGICFLLVSDSKLMVT